MTKEKSTPKQKITPNLWFDDQAEEAVNFYTSVFENSNIKNTTRYNKEAAAASGIPEGTVMTMSFEIEGCSFLALNGGPHFKINPSISFFLNFDPSKNENASDNLEEIWNKLAEGGQVLMELGEYPFSPKYGWVQDKYGVSWQLILSNPDGEDRPKIIPSLMFVGNQAGRAEEAISFYRDIFDDSETGLIARYEAGQEPDQEGTIMFADFKLEDQWFAAMDSAYDHKFGFNEGISFIVHCEDQDEVDYFWNKLSAMPEAEQCGWLKDKFGISWQIIPDALPELLGNSNTEKAKKAMEAMLQMKKIDIEGLKKAAES
ncbi:MAG TPA: VOC family protein [Balneolaceae bacterium]|nr:VOC family protein [Balneolaceae bacterium]